MNEPNTKTCVFPADGITTIRLQQDQPISARLVIEQPNELALALARANAAEQRPTPFILLSIQADVRYISPRCTQICAGGDIFISQGKLRFGELAVQHRFSDALAYVVQPACQTREAVFKVRRNGSSSLRCLLAAVCDDYVAFYVHDEAQAICINHQVLMELFSLTDSEARVAMDIAMGLDPQSIAERDNRSFHTIRSQLQSVFIKTRCNRQNQLAALILQSPAVKYT